jgi:hypothetical protein
MLKKQVSIYLRTSAVFRGVRVLACVCFRETYVLIVECIRSVGDRMRAYVNLDCSSSDEQFQWKIMSEVDVKKKNDNDEMS